MTALRVVWTVASVVTSTGLISCSGEDSASPVSARSSSSLPVAPPAVSGINRTVVVHWQLADSFDVLPDGKCAGRSIFREMHDGVRVQLIGNTTGLGDETRATTHVERRGASRSDDGQYCVVEAVFAPSVPDADGYSIKFAGSAERARWLGKPGGAPFGQPDPPPGYGWYNVGSQSCPSLLDPPDKDCPVAGN